MSVYGTSSQSRRSVIAIKALSGLAGAICQSVFSLMLSSQYALSSQHNGLVSACVVGWMGVRGPAVPS